MTTPSRSRPGGTPVPGPGRDEADTPALNLVILRGVLSGPPRVRTLVSGTALHSYEVTTRAGAGTAPAGTSQQPPAVTVPVVWLDPSRPPKLGAGDEVVVVGRVRRRFFRSGGATRSRTEVEAAVVARATASRARRALLAAVTDLSDRLEQGR